QLKYLKEELERVDKAQQEISKLLKKLAPTSPMREVKVLLDSASEKVEEALKQLEKENAKSAILGQEKAIDAIEKAIMLLREEMKSGSLEGGENENKDEESDKKDDKMAEEMINNESKRKIDNTYRYREASKTSMDW
ncbi:MAG: hypothetical protein ACRC37_04805, partial [Lentisphaeria bacterium]